MCVGLAKMAMNAMVGIIDKFKLTVKRYYLNRYARKLIQCAVHTSNYSCFSHFVELMGRLGAEVNIRGWSGYQIPGIITAFRL